MKKLLIIIFYLSFFLFASSEAFSAVSVYEFESLAQEKRFQSLAASLRCIQCQNQSLSDTNSDLGDDLKNIVYEKIIAGETDEQILQFMKARYGEFILFRPEWNQSNLFLWLAPGLFLLMFLTGFLLWYKRHKKEADHV